MSFSILSICINYICNVGLKIFMSLSVLFICINYICNVGLKFLCPSLFFLSTAITFVMLVLNFCVLQYSFHLQQFVMLILKHALRLRVYLQNVKTGHYAAAG